MNKYSKEWTILNWANQLYAYRDYIEYWIDLFEVLDFSDYQKDSYPEEIDAVLKDKNYSKRVKKISQWTIKMNERSQMMIKRS